MRALLAALLLAACGQASSSPPPHPRDDVHVLTGLPLFWGEAGVGGILHGEEAARSPLIETLDKQWAVHPLDVARDETLAPVRLLLIIQPQALAPDELVALDAWVRVGGTALFLLDPDLRWPSRLRSGDPRRAPVRAMLDPLLAHWGLALEANAASEPEWVTLAGKKVETEAAGHWRVTGDDCRVIGPLVAQCRLGQGRVTLVADVDFADPARAAAGAAGWRAIDSLLAQLQRKD